MAAAPTFYGLESCVSNKLALSSFISNAWFKHADNLRMVVRQDSNHPLEELDRAISKLCTITGHQRIIAPSSRHAVTPIPPSTSITGKRKQQRGGSLRDNRSKKRDFSTARCGICKQLGHTIGFHDRYVARQQSGLANVAHSAEESTSNSTEETPNDDVSLLPNDDTFDPEISDGAPIINSGSTYHITGSEEFLFDLQSCEPHAVEIADGGVRCGSEKGKMAVNELKGTV
ncbi:hypothetical protein ON010_g14102 [Phytophthora cinnamomi]|nr:hypothetical protein ON010_g14102 [Phytophthora cinnamomi]